MGNKIIISAIIFLILGIFCLVVEIGRLEFKNKKLEDDKMIDQLESGDAQL